MSVMREGGETQDMSGLEHAISDAALYEPVSAAPVCLATVALCGVRRHRIARVARVLAPTAVATACACVLVLRIASSGGAPTAIRPQIGLASAETGPMPLLVPAAGTRAGAGSTPEAFQAAFPKHAYNNAGRTRNSGRRTAKRADRRSTAAGKRPPPKVRLNIERVHHYYAGVMTPAWVSEQDPGTGRTLTTPVVLDVPVRPDPLHNELTSNGELRIIPAVYHEEKPR